MRPRRCTIVWTAASASRKNRERTLAQLCDQLGQARFDELAAGGARMSVGYMLAYARAGLPETAAEQAS